jgi:hypothetical protein
MTPPLAASRSLNPLAFFSAPVIVRFSAFSSGIRNGTKAAVMEFYGNYQVYSESGVDLTLLRENLKRTATELVEKNSGGIRLVAELRRAGRASRGLLSSEKPQLDLEVQKILSLLTDYEVQFVLIGGLAMRVHGSAHITEDLDVCYSRDPQNIVALASAFETIHPYLRGAPAGLPFRFDAPTIRAGLNFTLLTDLGDIDLLGEVSGIGDFEKALAQSEQRTIFELPVPVLSLDGLIAAKKAAGRGKDRQHLLELEELKKMRDAQP